MRKDQATIKRVAIATTLTGAMLSVPIASSAHFSHKNLVKGNYSEDVVTLQKILKSDGYYKLPKETGYFGTTTEKAVKQFQKDKGLVVDGIVGPKTKTALVNKSFHLGDRLLNQGDRGKDVMAVQTRLKQLGYYSGNLDGIYGPMTKKAVVHFQQQNHIGVDGIVGPQTIKTINNSPKSYQKPEVKTQKQSSRSLSNMSAVKELYVSSTAYTAYCAGCSGVTATGIDLRSHPNAKVVAVDPSVIPLGSKLYIQGYGYAVAGDTGGAIKGKRIDLFMSNRSDALDWGRRTVKVKILELP